MAEKSIRRFIAGAVCPSCHLIDKIVYERNAHSQNIFCVNCDYSDTKLNHDSGVTSNQGGHEEK